jgi:hypothetical protein
MAVRLLQDIWTSFFPEDPRILVLPARLGPYHSRLRDLPEDLPFVWDEKALANGTIFTLVTDVGWIDLLAEVTGLGSYDEARAESVEVDAFARRVRTLDLKSLIKSKRAAGREKNIAGLRELESLLEAAEPE